MVSLLMLKLVAHYKGRADDFSRMGDPAVLESLVFLCDQGILKKGSAWKGQTYSLTDKGEFYVEALCTLPFPVLTTNGVT